jgi:hypothetical protein
VAKKKRAPAPAAGEGEGDHEADVRRALAAQGEMDEVVLEACAEDYQSANTISAHTHIPHEEVEDALGRLFAARKVEKKKRIVRGTTFETYKAIARVGEGARA